MPKHTNSVLVILVKDLHDLGCRTIQPFEYYYFPEIVVDANTQSYFHENILKQQFIEELKGKKITSIEACKSGADVVLELYITIT